MRKPEIYEFEFQSSLCVLASLLTKSTISGRKSNNPRKKKLEIDLFKLIV
jgi:hypothetical protein